MVTTTTATAALNRASGEYMNRPPAFQFYVKDWLTSKKRATMTLEQQGAYINLLAHCWDSDDCSLIDDDSELAALSELRERWATEGSKVKQCFVPAKQTGRLTNERLFEMHMKLAKYCRDKQRAGQIGGVQSG